VTQWVQRAPIKSLKTLERVKGIEPSSSAWKIAGKLNDFNEPCVKWQPKTVLNASIFATCDETVRSAIDRFGVSVRLGPEAPLTTFAVEPAMTALRAGDAKTHSHSARPEAPSWSLNKDTPVSRPVQRIGHVK
jgi:hypothetical protein